MKPAGRKPAGLALRGIASSIALPSVLEAIKLTLAGRCWPT
jgi:hypothetical protein